ncbi:hypothetical protein LAZ67_21000206 [Cordylochernes scorpioides]|uniref:Uncharacterized protein n=1 Tax=Cordylochernes scorpioides TaxID=51811 RepID=A0ABY6LL47_9ARAC|nr:hypothetical protein LAZ67_21000206 [Cordylochernes scorpioides]
MKKTSARSVVLKNSKSDAIRKRKLGALPLSNIASRRTAAISDPSVNLKHKKNHVRTQQKLAELQKSRKNDQFHVTLRNSQLCCGSDVTSQHLSEVVFGAGQIIIVRKMTETGAALLHQILPEMNTIIPGDESWVLSGNQIPVVTVKAFHVTKTKEGLLSAQQCQKKENRVMVNRQLALPSQQCSSTFLALTNFLFDENPDSCGSPGSLLS